MGGIDIQLDVDFSYGALQAVTPLSTELPTKSSGNTDKGLMKKLKGFDALAMSIGNGNVESAEGGGEQRLSQRFVTICRS